ncbi:tetratricopeptide repeat protein [Pontibacter toksunensis]|uniref:histidine kinase n=1 Tax=Pontibacter toksunensis TaxID=1332631 RepID=A0ABW6BXR3_9BACT
MRITFLLLIFLFTTLPVVAQQATVVDSLKRELATAKPDTNQVKVLIELDNHGNTINSDTLLLYANRALELSKKLDYARGEARSLFSLVKIYYLKGDITRAFESLQQLLEVSQTNNYIDGIVLATNFYGIYYLENGDYQNALIRYKQALAQIRERENSPFLVAMLINVGKSFVKMNQLDSASIYLGEAVKLVHEAQLKHKFAGETLLSWGELQEKKGQFDLAMAYYHKALPVLSKQNKAATLSWSHHAIAKLHKERGQLDSAFLYAKKSYAFAEVPPIQADVLTEPSLLLSELYEGQHDHQEALQYYKIASAAKDSLYNKERMAKISNLLFNEQIKKRELEMSQKEYRSRMRIYGLLSVIGVVLLVALVLFLNNRQKQKANALLKQQKEKTEEALQELKTLQAQLIQSEKMASLGELTAGIAHEIQNPLNFVNNFSEVSTELVEELREGPFRQLPQEVTEEAGSILVNLEQNLHKIHHHGRRADAIVKNMLDHSPASSGERQLTNLNRLTDEYLGLAYHGFRAREKDFACTIHTDFDPKLENVEVVPQELGRVLLNLFNNAFYAVRLKQKYNPDGYIPKVEVQTLCKEGQVEIRVKDNGVGMSDTVKNKIFQPFFTTKATGQGIGLGLSLSYDIITKGHRGELQVQTAEGEYTEMIVKLPHKSTAIVQPALM